MQFNLSKIKNRAPRAIGTTISPKVETIAPEVLLNEPEGVDRNQVIDYLVGLSDTDFSKICEVSEIYRKAEGEAAKAIGEERTPVYYAFEEPNHDGEIIDPVEEDYDNGEITMLDEDDMNTGHLNDIKPQGSSKSDKTD